MSETMTNTEIIQRLTEKSIRPSLQRMAVYGYLANNQTHPTADTIFTALSPTIPTLSKTTVYNTLKQLAEVGLIHAITIEGSEMRYDADTSDHLHFKCISCGKVYDIFATPSIPDGCMPEGFTTERTQTSIWGKCSDCQISKK